MSGTIALPDGISIAPADPTISVSVAPAGGVTLPAGVPAYPLANDPSQTWDLQDVNGVLTWVQFSAPPGERAFALESGIGAIALEDGDGVLLMEN